MNDLLGSLQNAWSNVLVPFVTMLWDMAWHDPLSFVAVLLFIYGLIWAYQSSVNLGR